MTLTKTALYRASLLADNLGIRLCLAAALVMPSALLFLVPAIGLLGAGGDEPLTTRAAFAEAAWTQALDATVRCLGFAAAWLRIVCSGAPLLRWPTLRWLVVGALAAGAATLAGDLAAALLGRPASEGAGWLLLSALAVHVFLLAGTLGQPRHDRLNRF